MILDAVIIVSIFAFVLVWLVRGVPRRRLVLAALAVVGVTAATVSFVQGRWQAAPALALAGLFLLLGLMLLRLRDPKRTGLPWLSGGALLIVGVLALTPLYLFPMFAPPAPSGPYAIGVRDFDMTDASRTGVGESPAGEPRRLFVRVWYPATPAPGAHPRPYATKTEAETVFAGLARSFRMPGFFFSHLRMIPTHSYTDAPVRTADGPYPVVFFSHGFGSQPAQNAVLMEELASRGYVIFAPAHTWDSPEVRFTDGSLAIASPPKRSETPEEETSAARKLLLASNDDERFDGLRRRYDSTRRYEKTFVASISTWLADRLFLEHALAGDEAPQSVADILAASDFTKIAHTGMSFGGSTAGAACLADPSCVAAVNLDGADYHDTPLDARMPAPFLMVHSDWRRMAALLHSTTPADPGKAFNDFSYEPFETAGATTDVVRLRINNVDHLGISDFGLMLRRPVRDLLVGPADGRKVTAVLSSFVGDFLDHAVRGIDNGYPDANFARFPGAVDRHDAGHVHDWWTAKTDAERQAILADVSRMSGRPPPTAEPSSLTPAESAQ